MLLLVLHLPVTDSNAATRAKCIIIDHASHYSTNNSTVTDLNIYVQIFIRTDQDHFVYNILNKNCFLFFNPFQYGTGGEGGGENTCLPVIGLFTHEQTYCRQSVNSTYIKKLALYVSDFNLIRTQKSKCRIFLAAKQA